MQSKLLIGFTIFIILAIVTFLGCSTAFKRYAYEGFGSRDQWQQADRVITKLEIAKNSVVVDLGAGGGYFTFRIARHLGGSGRVYAVDVSAEMLDYIEARSVEQGMDNITVVLASENDPGILQDTADLVVVSNTYHHIKNRVSYFENLKSLLNENGRIAIIEFKDTGFFSRLSGHGSNVEQIRAEMQLAGLRLINQYDFLSKQHFLVFSR